MHIRDVHVMQKSKYKVSAKYFKVAKVCKKLKCQSFDSAKYSKFF